MSVIQPSLPHSLADHRLRSLSGYANLLKAADGWLLGSQAFVQRIKGLMKTPKCDDEVPLARRLVPQVTIEGTPEPALTADTLSAASVVLIGVLPRRGT